MGVLPQLVSLVKPLAILVGPAPVFYLYRLWHSNPLTVPRQRRPLPKQSLVAITILLILSLIYVWILLFGGSENVFYLTRSRFVTPISVLQSRVSKFRPVTEIDGVLLERLAASLSERINFATFGPLPLTHCSWCQTIHTGPTNGTITLGDATMYLLFSFPAIVAPYLAHTFALGVITTPFLSLSQTSRDLRVYMSYALGLTLAAELWILATFDGTVNSSASELRDVTWLHWDLHSFRFAMLCLFSITHAVIIYAIETSWVALPPSSNERLFQVSVLVENIAHRMKLARTVREVTMTKGEWRQRVQEWWDKRRNTTEDIPDIPEELRRNWEGEARRWVDGKIQFQKY